MKKSDLRKEIRERKRRLTPSQIETASRALAGQLFAHPFYRQARSLYGYLSYNQEVLTLPILRRAQRDGKRVAVPKVFGDTMRFLWLDDLGRIACGYRGIPEPMDSDPVADDPTALVLMPGLAFDASGRRLGYGDGEGEAVKLFPTGDKFAIGGARVELERRGDERMKGFN